jgi:hypothetical protein
MREWLYVLAPVLVVAYFMIFPDQYAAVVVWAERFVR